MASLKEIKNRITSVNGTKKITSAMKMVASAKLHRAQGLIDNALPYKQKLDEIAMHLIEGSTDSASPYAVVRPVERVAIVVFSSNTGLCGTFNANVIKETKKLIQSFQSKDILIFPIGKKIMKSMENEGFTVEKGYEDILERLSYGDVSNLADRLMDLFLSKQVDRIELLYHHFKGKSSQELIQETFLPILTNNTAEIENKVISSNYIVEPTSEELISLLHPRALKFKLYYVMLDSNAAEHAARTMAMQTATDNANDLLQELTVYYNKTRQQSITNELLDIMGGASK
ncbi:MAG: ATP synthase F1 subunit gamma [Parabacteroides sp.]|nr:ATP synthase F1 subunit gamma [Parabacteroides sp.]MBP9580229.1 ATP synthase F1 subunit gamma [Parabacteroides sp.]MDD2415657.1 ATP synthase F1 subunit gamma [Parabacteroides sp.]MDD3358945.1 ATP synthase F1 subunit gamma [Parabacteroides sp.]